MGPVTTLTSQESEARLPFEWAGAGYGVSSWVAAAMNVYLVAAAIARLVNQFRDGPAHAPCRGPAAKSSIMARRADARPLIRDGWARLFTELDVLLMQATTKAAPQHLITIGFATRISRLVLDRRVPPVFA